MTTIAYLNKPNMKRLYADQCIVDTSADIDDCGWYHVQLGQKIQISTDKQFAWVTTGDFIGPDKEADIRLLFELSQSTNHDKLFDRDFYNQHGLSLVDNKSTELILLTSNKCYLFKLGNLNESIGWTLSDQEIYAFGSGKESMIGFYHATKDIEKSWGYVMEIDSLTNGEIQFIDQTDLLPFTPKITKKRAIRLLRDCLNKIKENKKEGV